MKWFVKQFTFFSETDVCSTSKESFNWDKPHCWWCSAATCGKYVGLYCSHQNGDFFARFISILSPCEDFVHFTDKAYGEKWPAWQWHFTPWHSNNNSWLKYKSPYWQLLVLELRALMCFKCRSQVSHSPYTLKHLHLYIWQKCACILAGSLRVQTFSCLGHAM